MLYLNSTKSIYTSTINRTYHCLQTLHISSRKDNPLVALTQKISHLSLKGEIENARKIFNQMGSRDSVSYNVMMKCYVENKMIESAREVFDEMPERTSFSWNTMIMGYIKQGKTHIALKMFVVMPDKDVVTWTAMITGLCRASMVDDAWRLFKQMPHANAVSWSSIVSGFQQNGFAYESLKLFREMLLAGIQPNSHLFTSVLSSCADLSMVSASEQVYCHLLKRGFHEYTHVANSSISMFVKTGNFHDARRVFVELDKPDRVTWNAMITGFAQNGLGLEAIMTFHQMQKSQFRPDGISYIGVLHGCSHCGFVEEGKAYFRSMKTDYGISPKIEHFSTMVDLYARAGHIREAYNVILDLPFEATSIFWRTLLNGCRIWGDLKIGVFAAEKILKIEPYNSSACLMAINIFASIGKWNKVAEMRRRIRGLEARKELGCSWIDIKGKNHLFTTRDEFHPEADKIFPIIELLSYDVERYYSCLEGSIDGLNAVTNVV